MRKVGKVEITAMQCDFALINRKCDAHRPINRMLNVYAQKHYVWRAKPVILIAA